MNAEMCCSANNITEDIDDINDGHKNRKSCCKCCDNYQHQRQSKITVRSKSAFAKNFTWIICSELMNIWINFSVQILKNIHKIFLNYLGPFMVIVFQLVGYVY